MRGWLFWSSLGLGLVTVLTFNGSASGGQRYAFLVAVREYDKSELNPLQFTENDITGLAEALADAGYPSENIVLMTQTVGAKSTRYLPLAENIRTELALVLRELQADDSVLVAFSGHGVQFKDEKRSYFCPADAKLARRETLIALDDVLSALDRSRAGTKVLLVDACRNDPQAARSKAAREVDLEAVGRRVALQPPGGIAAFFSCSATEQSYEDPALEHGVFFHFVIDALGGTGDLDRDGEISLGELEQHVVRNVQRHVRVELSKAQTPERHGETRGLVTLARTGTSVSLAPIASLVDEQVFAVAHVDLSRLDMPALRNLLVKVLPPRDAASRQEYATLEGEIQPLIASLASNGMRELFTCYRLHEEGCDVVVLAPVEKGHDPQLAARLLGASLGLEGEAIGGLAIARSELAGKRLKVVRPVPRPDLEQAFAAGGRDTLRLAYAPGNSSPARLRELLPEIVPFEVGATIAGQLADDVEWGGLSGGFAPEPSAKSTVQTRNSSAAAALRTELARSLAAWSQEADVRQSLPKAGELVAAAIPTVQGNRLVLQHTGNDHARQLPGLLAAAAALSAQTSARRLQSQNNLKMLALGMHNYCDQHKTFPPQAIRSKEGQPLLSWRVAVLPFCEQRELYEQFHLDEPWDSPHNRTLIAKMPREFGSPMLGDRRGQGLTTYFVPLTRQPGAPGPAQRAPFDQQTGPDLISFHDGLSLTIFILEAHPTSAVVWTKPDDLLIDLKAPLKSLTGQAGGGFPASFGDAHVEIIRDRIDPEIFRRLLWMNDGQPLPEKY